MAAQLDSATQGPNPQDIATPEPEYIDDEPEPPRPQAPVAAPASFATSFAAPQARIAAPASFASSFAAPQQPQQAPSHSFGFDGYRYRRPSPRVYYRRVYRYRY